jgi:membrane peptidoglycan carboxypeptidase
MGIRTELQPVCSITLGSQGVTPLDMADSYATLASRGVHRSPISIAQVRSSSGEMMFRANTAGQRVLLQNNADLVTSALQHVITGGTGTAADIGRPAAGKTGTAQDYVDAWFCGYTPQLVTCVWMGYPKNEKVSMDNVEGFPHVFGGSLPARIWHDFMSTAMQGVPVANFATPSLAGYNVNPQGAVTPTPSPSPSPSPSPKPSPTPSPLPSLPTPTPSESPPPSPTPTPSKH